MQQVPDLMGKIADNHCVIDWRSVFTLWNHLHRLFLSLMQP